MSAIQELIKFCRITLGGSDNDQIPKQQIGYMGNVADAFIIFPYGMHANATKDALGIALNVNNDDQQIAVFITSSIERIKNLKEGEVIFFHPKTKTFTHYKNSGDVDISVNGSENVTITKDWNIIVTGDVNLTAASVNIDASVTNLGVGGNAIARTGDAVDVLVVGGSSAGTHTGTITGGGSNTSI